MRARFINEIQRGISGLSPLGVGHVSMYKGYNMVRGWIDKNTKTVDFIVDLMCRDADNDESKAMIVDIFNQVSEYLERPLDSMLFCGKSDNASNSGSGVMLNTYDAYRVFDNLEMYTLPIYKVWTKDVYETPEIKESTLNSRVIRRKCATLNIRYFKDMEVLNVYGEINVRSKNTRVTYRYYIILN